MFRSRRVVQIVAKDLNDNIGKGNALPWRCRADLEHFKSKTLYRVCIMGRRTFESLPQPLKQRTVIVVSSCTNEEYRKKIIDIPKHIPASSVEEALDIADKLSLGGDIMVVGGKQIYQQTMRYTDKILMSVINCNVKDADTRFDIEVPDSVEIEYFDFEPDPPRPYTDEELRFLNILLTKHGHKVTHVKRYDGNNGEYIGRTSEGLGKWGNGFSHIPNVPNTVLVSCRERGVLDYYKEQLDLIQKDPAHVEIFRPLIGKDLLCWCSNGTRSRKKGARYCHGHAIHEIIEKFLL